MRPYKKTLLTAEDINTLDLSGLTAYMATTGFGVDLLMNDGTICRADYIHSDITPEDIKPQLRQTELRAFEVLGLGNVLFFRPEDAGWLLEKRNDYMERSKRYRHGNMVHERIVLYKNWVRFFREYIAERNANDDR